MTFLDIWSFCLRVFWGGGGLWGYFGGGVGEVGFGCGFLFVFFCCGGCSLGFGLGFLGGGGCFFVFCFLRKMLAKFTTTTLNGLGRIRTNTGVSIWDSHLRFPFQSGKKNRHSQSMSHLILASTISKTGQTNHDLKAPMPLPYQVSQLARAQIKTSMLWKCNAQWYESCPLWLEHSTRYDYYPSVLHTKLFLYCSSFGPDISVQITKTPGE